MEGRESIWLWWGSEWVSENAYLKYLHVHLCCGKCVVVVKEKLVHIQRHENAFHVELCTTDTSWWSGRIQFNQPHL